jgi:hypothetical protein
MKPGRLLAALLAIVVLVVAVGFAFPVAPDDAGSSERYAEEPVEVEGGEIGADQTELWAWTQRAMDRNVDATPTVVIRDFEDTAGGNVQPEATAFQRLLVYDDPDASSAGSALAFVTAFSTDVNVNEDRLPAVRNRTTGRTVESLLVHEYAHVVQFQTDGFADAVPSAISATADEISAYQATVEGGAEFVADHYTDDSEIERVRRYWNDPGTTAAQRLTQWPYYRGLVYLDERLEEPSDLWSVYADQPETTATILRGDAPGDGPPDRSVSLDIEDYHTEVDDRPGAVLAEVALTRAIHPEDARQVAAGWRWGALRSIQPDSGTADDRTLRHVWTTEWRNETAADAFEGAMTEYLDERWTRANGTRNATEATWDAADGQSFALERVDDTSLAVLAGPEAFLAGTTVTVSGDEYRIESANGSAANAGVLAPSEAAFPTGTRAGA